MYLPRFMINLYSCAVFRDHVVALIWEAVHFPSVTQGDRLILDDGSSSPGAGIFVMVSPSK